VIYQTEEQLLHKAQQAEGKTFGEIDQYDRVKNERAKGHLGQIVEESFFGYVVNSKKEADFSNLEIELKVTPIKKNKNGTLSAKERLVLNIINYYEEINYTFHTSSFWTKNKNLLLMFYLWIPKQKRADYKIIKSYLHRFPEEDLIIIKQDWEHIVGKIRDGKAHELSEADTNYLAACPKGANKSSLRKQPFNDELAMQRAFSLKQSYMTTLVRSIINKDNLVHIANKEELQKKSLAKLLQDRFSPFIHQSLTNIAQQTELQVNTKSKAFLQEFVSALLGISGTKLNEIDEFAKANIQFKTIRLEPNGRPREHMSFKNINFTQWLQEDWNSSWVKNYFEETKFLFVVFYYNETKKCNPNRELHFQGIKLWNMPKTIIDNELHTFFLHLQELIHAGIELKEVRQKNRTIVQNNLPKADFNNICHIRPKARNSKDKVALPNGDKIIKQAFWLNNTYIENIIKP